MSDDLFARIGATQPPAGQIALWYLGGAGYVVQTANTSLVIDPFIGPGSPPEWTRAIPPPFTAGQVGPVDAVFLTHEHDDHADPVALAAFKLRTEAVIIGPKSCVPIIKAVNVPRQRWQLLPHHATRLLGDFRVTAVPMLDPTAKSCNGYVLEAQGVTILHCGDGQYFDGFIELAKRWRFDAVCVSVGYNPPGKLFYMDEADAARAARDTRTKRLIVHHYDLWQGYTIDPQRVATVVAWYAPKTEVIAAPLGQCLAIER